MRHSTCKTTRTSLTLHRHLQADDVQPFHTAGLLKLLQTEGPTDTRKGHLHWELHMGKNPEPQCYHLHFFFSSEGNVSSCLALLSKGGAQKEQNWEIRKNSSLGKAMLLPGQLNEQLSSAGSDFTARMLKTTSKDNKINSIKRIIKHFKSTIQKNTESVRWHRTFRAGNKDHYFPS